MLKLGASLGWIFCVAVLSGCAGLPTTGPAPNAIFNNSEANDPGNLPYAVISLAPETIDILATYAPQLRNTFPDRQPPKEIKFGVGDVVSVTIFEAAAGGLFIPIEAGVRPGNFVNLPNQNVDTNGNISVPYAGPVRAKGRTPSEVQQSIVDLLRNRAIEPQAVVSLVDQRTSLVSVFGEVNSPSRFPINAAGERILDSITRAGGPRAQGFDTWIMVERDGRRATAPFGALVYEPSNNIWTQPEDSIYVYREPQNYLAFGATGQQGQFNFDAWRISLAEAVAKAGGLNDILAEPAAVFLYRGETRELAERMGIDCSRFPGPIVPVIYHANLRDPAGYFLTTKFQMRNKDVLYISNASTVEAAKAMQFFRLVVATANDPIVAAINAVSVRNLIRTSP